MHVYRILLLLSCMTAAAFSATAQTRQAAPVSPAPVAASQVKMARAMIDLPEVDWTDQAAKDTGSKDFLAVEGVMEVRPHPNSHGFLLLFDSLKVKAEEIVAAMEDKGYQVELMAAPKRAE